MYILAGVGVCIGIQQDESQLNNPGSWDLVVKSKGLGFRV